MAVDIGPPAAVRQRQRQRDVSGVIYMVRRYHRRFLIRTVCDNELSQTVLIKNRLYTITDGSNLEPSVIVLLITDGLIIEPSVIIHRRFYY